MWKLKTIRAKNFMCYKSVLINVTPGITHITASVRSKLRADSNGGGKSALVEIPTFCLWGQLLRKASSLDRVVRRGSKSGCMAEVVLESADGKHTFRVRRYRKHPANKNALKVWLDGSPVEAGTTPIAEAEIERVLCMNFAQYLRKCAFCANEHAVPFTQMQDTARKDLLEASLPLGWISKAREYVLDKLSQCETLAGELDATVSRAEQECIRIRGMLSVSDTRTEIVSRKAIVKVRKRVRALEEQNETADAVWDAYRKEAEEYDAKVSALRSQLSTESADVRAAETAYDLAEKAVQKYRRAVRRGVCSVCGEKTGNRAKGRKKALLRVLADCGHAVDAAKMHVEMTERRIATLSKNAPQRPDYDAAEIQAALASARSKLALLRDMQTQQRTADGKREAEIKKLKVKLNEAETEMRDAQVSLRKNRRLARDLQFASDGFSPSGIRASLLKSTLPEIGETATRFARKLIHPDAVISVSPTTHTQRGEARDKISVVVAVPGVGEDYSMLSSGQKARADLCVFLAVGRFYARRMPGGIGMLFVDELLDGLDRTGSEIVLDVLREYAAGMDVLLITHDASVAAEVDAKISIEHNGKVATIKAV